MLMLTAYREVDDLVAGLALGADDYPAKPFAFDELLGARAGARAKSARAREAILSNVRVDTHRDA
jgi:DNA-binding response OmpR family regulator